MTISSPAVDTFADQLSQAKRQLAAGLPDVDQAAGELISIRAGAIAPRSSGSLASAHVVRAGVITNPRSYAAPVHWGWVRGAARVAGRPWILQAGTDRHDEAVDLYVAHNDKTVGGIST